MGYLPSQVPEQMSRSSATNGRYDLMMQRILLLALSLTACGGTTTQPNAPSVPTDTSSPASPPPSSAPVNASNPFSDGFEITGELSGSGWSTFNPSAVPGAAKRGGQYHSGPIAIVGSTTWFNADRGRADWKLVSFPAAGQGEIEIIAHNVGVGPAENASANLTVGAWAFCGLIVHTSDTASPNYEFLLPSRRNGIATIESKTTIAGVSNPADVGANPVGPGVTRADVRVLLRSDRTVRWAFRRPRSGDAWTAINMGSGVGVSQGGGLTFSSGSVWVGLITYAFDSVPVPFVGTADALTMTGIAGN